MCALYAVKHSNYALKLLCFAGEVSKNFNGRNALFQGETFQRFDEARLEVLPTKYPISSKWPGVQRHTEAAVTLNDGYSYFFKGQKSDYFYTLFISTVLDVIHVFFCDIGTGNSTILTTEWKLVIQKKRLDLGWADNVRKVDDTNQNKSVDITSSAFHLYFSLYIWFCMILTS